MYNNLTIIYPFSDSIHIMRAFQALRQFEAEWARTHLSVISSLCQTGSFIPKDVSKALMVKHYCSGYPISMRQLWESYWVPRYPKSEAFPLRYLRATKYKLHNEQGITYFAQAWTTSELRDSEIISAVMLNAGVEGSDSTLKETETWKNVTF